ncbi:VOC family protein [Streptomyces finlayi]|uniref:VOC family protein n=1 Tax=Streptomyces finlayi TaxID=67296 RepID=A0A7G7BW23_9ACTN|nr:VOC family protein [Streptomyces finlayi]
MEKSTTDASGLGAPCWASLATRSLTSSQEFYGAVLGWTFRATDLGDEFSVALYDGVPTAGLAELTNVVHIANDWTPYFAVPDADAAAARIRERMGTLAVGPIDFPIGRAAVAADRAGARFGVWQGRLVADWQAWRAHRPWWLDLTTPNPFEAALFYGEILDWASELPGSCEVGYEHDDVVLRDDGRVAALITAGAEGSEILPGCGPRWNVHFPVRDVGAALKTAVRLGGRVLERRISAQEDGATLRDPYGAVFCVASATGPPPAQGGYGQPT